MAACPPESEDIRKNASTSAKRAAPPKAHRMRNARLILTGVWIPPPPTSTHRVRVLGMDAAFKYPGDGKPAEVDQFGTLVLSEGNRSPEEQPSDGMNIRT